MNSTIFFEGKHGGFYLYDMYNKYLLNSHPIIEQISKIETQDVSIIKDIVMTSNPEIEEQLFDLYYSNFLFLKSSGFFIDIDIKDMLSGKVTVDVIERNISNLGQVVFQVTNDCNLKCKYCCFGDLYNGIPVEKKKMNFNMVKLAFEFLLPYWNSEKNYSSNSVINIGFYGGEPLMNFKLIKQVVSYCRNLRLDSNKRFTYNITTNATLLPKYIDFLVSNDFDLLISLDGDKRHDSYRVDRHGRQTFNVVFENAKFVQEKYPDYFEKKVQFNSVLTNKATVEDIHQFIFSTFGKIPLIDPVSTTDLKDDEIASFKQLNQNYIENASLTQERGTISIFGKGLSHFFYYNLNNAFRHYIDLMTNVDTTMFKRIPTGTCLPFGNKMYISATGNIMTCERIAMNHIIGRITDEGVRIDFEKLANDYNHYFDGLRERCRKCYLAMFCPVCIFQNKFSNGLPQCFQFVSEDQYKLYLGRIVGLLEEKPDLFFEFNKTVFA